MKRVILFSIIMAITSIHCLEISHEFYGGARYTDSNHDSGVRLSAEYYPSLQQVIYHSGNIIFDGYIQLSSSVDWSNINDEESKFSLDLYRCWLRSNAEQSELRLGLQKINFGTATYLRSLQWFDHVDAYDPRHQTEGVWGILYRHYMLDNSNYWFWVLYDETDLKGMEDIHTRENTLELGGRLQLPILGGDLGFSYHNRALQDMSDLEAREEVFDDHEEQRVGIDGRWDIGIGIWVESSVSYYKDISVIPELSEFYTVGSDYTLNCGNGLHILIEHQYIRKEDKLWKYPQASYNSSILALDYPMGLYNTLLGTAGYDHDSEKGYFHLSSQWTFDYLSIYLNLSWNPERAELESSIGSGSTAELLFQLNY